MPRTRWSPAPAGARGALARDRHGRPGAAASGDRNLLANVRAHTPAEAAAVVRVRRDGAGAVLEIEDEGPGLSAEQAAHVFERFYRGDPSRSRDHGGAGLGLAIVAAIVEAHGGAVGLETAPGAGTTFRVTLPDRPSLDQPKNASQSA